MFLWVLLLLVAGLLVVLFALFEIAFFASSPIAVRALGESVEEARTLRERLADPLVVLIPARSGLLAAGALFGFALDRLGFGATGLLWTFGVFVPAWFVLREVVPAAILLRDPEEVLRPLLPWFGRWERVVRPLAEPLRNLLRRGFPLPSEPDDEASYE